MRILLVEDDPLVSDLVRTGGKPVQSPASHRINQIQLYIHRVLMKPVSPNEMLTAVQEQIGEA